MSINASSQVAVQERTTSLEPGFGPIADLLVGFQQQGASGMVCVDAVLEGSVSKRVFLFQDGWVIYAGKAIPEPGEFLAEISQHLETTVLREALGFAAKRTSVRRVVDALVKVGVVGWSEVIEAVRLQVLSLLTELKGASGRVYLKSSASAFDLRYENGMTGFAIDELLAALDRGPERDFRPTIVSVDDSPIVHKIVERHLGQSYKIVRCQTAVDAISALYQEQGTIACLLLDLTLPDMDGLDLCGVVRKRFGDLPIVMLTSRDKITDRIRGRLAGANRYITKPFSPTELLAAVA